MITARPADETMNTIIAGFALVSLLSVADGPVASIQTSDGRRQLGAVLQPILQAIASNTQTFGIAGGNRVVVTDALDETTVATIAGIGSNDVVKRTLLGTATSKTNNNHDCSLIRWNWKNVGS